MKILFLSRWYPYPPDNGSKIRIFNLLQGLSERHDVTLISFYDPAENIPTDDMKGRGLTEVQFCPYQEFHPSSRRAFLGYFKQTPRWLVDTHSPEMEDKIHRAIRKTSYDLIIASQIPMASYYRSFLGIPAIFEEAELGVFWPQRNQKDSRWVRMRRKLTWLKHRRFMSQLLGHFRHCTVASEVERRMLAKAVPYYQSVHVIPNSLDVDFYAQTQGERVPGSLIFAGSLRFTPNHEAMTWFLSEIYPVIRAEMPGVRLTITGDPGHQPLSYAPDVVLTGRVNDVHSAVASSAVSLAPIRTGGGTRLKILESIALRTPVVATTKAVEGLEMRDGEHLLIADTPREYARAVLRFLREPDYARKIAESAFNLVRHRYDRRVVLPHFMRLVDQAAGS